jgi:hypothetical protein
MTLKTGYQSWALVAHAAILATWEAEIGRIKVRGQPRQIFKRSHLQNNQSKRDWRYDLSSKASILLG